MNWPRPKYAPEYRLAEAIIYPGILRPGIYSGLLHRVCTEVAQMYHRTPAPTIATTYSRVQSDARLSSKAFWQTRPTDGMVVNHDLPHTEPAYMYLLQGHNADASYHEVQD